MGNIFPHALWQHCLSSVKRKYPLVRRVLRQSNYEIMAKMKYGLIIGFVAATVVALVPIAINPMIDSSYYQKQQKINRKGTNLEETQPGNMKVWSDPFNRK